MVAFTPSSPPVRTRQRWRFEVEDCPPDPRKPPETRPMGLRVRQLLRIALRSYNLRVKDLGPA